MKVTILFNPPSLPAEHPDFASEAGVLESLAAFQTALRQSGHDCWALEAVPPIDALLDVLQSVRPDVVVNFCESFAGDSAGESLVAAELERLAIPFTGSSSACLTAARNKMQTKQLLTAAEIPTPDGVFIEPAVSLPRRELQELLLAGPLLVKPAAEDASLGIGPESVAAEWPALELQISRTRKKFGRVLVERYLAGREINVGLIALPELEVLPLAEIEFRAATELPWPIVTYDAKWRSESLACQATPVRCPAQVDRELSAKIENLAKRAFRAIDCRDYARVDFRVDSAGQPFVIEVNANPDAGPGAGLARALRVAQIEYREFVNRLVSVAACRGVAAAAAGA